ncbi:hypothetical protein GUA87_08045 [Sneathiella sp. P13V-1]|uniref:hypothetical protein n=1 Tax=Sneathiella sp. P13V-1 TaxID=2697366 RepID=UPI00187B8980|nr:hypothetical protein [Sneathiella sp. P13V-1]MBE7636791.1 hypothetical protein [Sneathiella sp. P13V-1]
MIHVRFEKWLKAALLISVVFSISACQTTEPEINANSVDTPNFSNTAITHFHAYLYVFNTYPNHHNVFMYDLENGRTSWSGKKKHLGVEFAKAEGHKRCQKRPYSGNCKVVAVDGEIVWKNLDKNLINTLLSPPTVNSPLKISEYSEAQHKITSLQLSAYTTYLQRQKKYSRALFFISEDGITSQQSLSITGDMKKETPKDLLHMGNVMCQLKSNGSNCYLFAMGDQPINKEAELSLN